MPEPATAVTLPKVQVPVRPFGVATRIGAGEVGSVSVKIEVRVAGLALVLPRTIVSADMPPDGMEVGKNCLAMAGGLMIRSVSLAGFSLVTPCRVARPPAGMVFR